MLELLLAYYWRRVERLGQRAWLGVRVGVGAGIGVGVGEGEGVVASAPECCAVPMS